MGWFDGLRNLVRSGRGHVRVASLLAMAALMAGCSSENGSVKPYAGALYPVTGKVLLANGKPLTTGRIIFMRKNEVGLAVSDLGSDGAFNLKQGDGRDGAAPGDYKVRLEPTTVAASKPGQPISLPFPSKYADIDGDTGLTAVVKEQPTTLEPFTLDAK